MDIEAVKKIIQENDPDYVSEASEAELDDFAQQICDLEPKPLSNAQAEISFRAGIKEAVEWIHEEFGGYIPDLKGGLVLKDILIDEEYGETGSMDKWKAKLKEWGIDG